MDKIIFLDRDGTINEEVEYLYKTSDLVIIPGVPAALKRLKENGFRLVVVTNQAGIARGYYSERDVIQLHSYMNNILLKDKAGIDHFFYCPHHPDQGVGIYKKKCRCRKPDIGMFEMTEDLFQVDKSHSYMIGDKLLDTEAGHKYGIEAILVGTGYGKELYAQLAEKEKEKAFDAYAKDMEAAVEWILKREGEKI